MFPSPPPPMLSLVSAGETGDRYMKWLPDKAELLKRAMDNECQRTWKQWLPARVGAASEG